nr:unnamed protein product [Callosobruchus chinensis]
MKDGPPMVTPVDADTQENEQVEEKEPKKRTYKKKKQVETQILEASADASTSAQNYPGDSGDKKTEKHVLVRKNFTKMCRNCYNFNSSRFGAKEVKTKSKRVNTYCLTCPGFPPLCVDCFIRTHKQ